MGGASEITGGQTIADMITEQQFQCCPSHDMNFIGLAVDLHIRQDPRCARWQQLVALSILYQTNLTRSGGFVALEVTERWDFDSQRRVGQIAVVLLNRLQNGHDRVDSAANLLDEAFNRLVIKFLLS